ncbi:MAG: hypothetical protein ACLQK4_06935 [Acidimicrobiales bacterium]
MPFSRSELVKEADGAGFSVSARLVTDWASIGLLAQAERQRGKQGKRGAHYLWSDNQRDLFITLLQHREEVGHVAELAVVPIWVWLLWGEPFIELPQTRAALRTWVGGHDKASSFEKAEAAARAIVKSIARPGASRAARGELRELLAEAALTGTFNRAVFVPLIKAVIDPQGLGPAHVDADGLADYYEAITLGAHHLSEFKDGAYLEARLRYRTFVSQYALDWDELRSNPVYGGMFERPSAQLLLDKCGRDLLLLLGLRWLADSRGQWVPPPNLAPGVGLPTAVLRHSLDEAGLT